MDRQNEYAQEIRENMVASIKAGLLSQELYDESEDEIMTELSDPTVFLDPYKHYRAVEEFFQINLYTFKPSAKSGKDIVNVLEIPRHKLFHAHLSRFRYAVVVFKYLGSDANNLTYPQCELIVDKVAEGKYLKIYPAEFSYKLNEIMLNIQKVYSWNSFDNSMEWWGYAWKLERTFTVWLIITS